MKGFKCKIVVVRRQLQANKKSTGPRVRRPVLKITILQFTCYVILSKSLGVSVYVNEIEANNTYFAGLLLGINEIFNAKL